MPQDADSRSELVEELVSRCLLADDSKAEQDAIGREHPDLAPRVARVLDLLRREELDQLVTGSASRPFPERLGEFRLLREVGAGGMGVVYLAEQQGLGRPIALKIIRPERLYLPGTRERFRREVEAAARLQHPGIVQVFTVGEDDGVPYYAMEYVEGRSLAEIVRGLENRPLSGLRQADMVETTEDVDAGAASWPQACVEVVVQIAQALQHAHERGVLHRDVKPSNILVTRAGRARLVDFGLARTEGADQLTRSTTQLGSLPYMAPEQISGEATIPSPTLDVYALGVTLYELLALRNPVLGKNAEETQRNIIDAAPPGLRARNPSVSRDLETVCMCALSRNPAQRYPRMADFCRDLNNIQARRPIEARRPGRLLRARRWLQRHPRVATASLVALLSMAVGGGAFGIREAQARHRADADRERTRRQAYAANMVAASMHLVGRASPDEARALLESCDEDLREWEWFHIAQQVDESRRLLDLNDGSSWMTWSPDGREIWLGPPTGEVQIVDPHSGERRTLAIGPTGLHGACLVHPSDGRVFVSEDDGSITIRDPATGEATGSLRADTAHTSDIACMEWVAEGRRLLTGDATGRAVLWDVETGTPQWAFEANQGPIMAFAATSDGSRIATSGTDPAMFRGKVRVWDVATRQPIDELDGRTFAAIELTSTGEWLLAADGGALVIKKVGGGPATSLVPGQVPTFDLRNDDELAVVEMRERRLRLYRLDLAATPRVRPRAALRGFQNRQLFARFQPGGDLIATVGYGGLLHVWNPTQPRAQLRWGPLPSMASACVFEASQASALVGTWRGGVHRLDVQTGEVTDLASPHTAKIRDIVVSETAFATVGCDWTVATWHTGASDPDWVLPTEAGELTSAALVPSTDTVIVGLADGRIQVWNRTRRSLERSFTAHDGFVSGLAVSPDGSVLATCGEDGGLRTWNWRDGTLHRELPRQETWVKTVRFAPGGNKLFAAGAAPEVRIYDLEAGREERRLTGFASPPDALAVGAAGKRAFTNHGSDGVRVWDVVSGRCVAHIGVGESRYCLATNREVSRVIAGGAGRTVVVWTRGTMPAPAPPAQREAPVPQAPWQLHRGPRTK